MLPTNQTVKAFSIIMMYANSFFWPPLQIVSVSAGTVIGECRGDPYSCFASTKATCQRSQVPGGDKKKDVVET